MTLPTHPGILYEYDKDRMISAINSTGCLLKNNAILFELDITASFLSKIK